MARKRRKWWIVRTTLTHEHLVEARSEREAKKEIWYSNSDDFALCDAGKRGAKARPATKNDLDRYDVEEEERYEEEEE